MKQRDFKNNKEIRNYNAKCFANFRSSFGEERKEVRLDSIRLEEIVHINAKVRLDREVEYYKANQKEVKGSLIVRQDENGFVLLAGWKYYHLAHALGQEMVKVIITKFKSRLHMLRSIGCCKPLRVCKITDLKIPATFDCSMISPKKLWAIKEYEYKHHAQAKPIVVNKDMLIVDGYAQYVYNRNMGKEYCEVRLVK